MNVIAKENIRKREERRKKIINKINNEKQLKERYGEKGYNIYKNTETLAKFGFYLLSLFPMLILSNIIYLISDIISIPMYMLFKDNFNVYQMQRDIDGALYKPVCFYNKYFNIKQPFILWTYKKPSYYDSKSFMY